MLFSLPKVAVETVCLLLSSFTCGPHDGWRRGKAMTCSPRSSLAITALLGLAFLAIELQEFAALLREGAGPDRSAFLSAFFALVGCHGLHVTPGCSGSPR